MRKIYLFLLLLVSPLWSANLGFTGGETGDTNELASQSGVTLDSSIKNTGAYSYKLDATADFAERTVTASDSLYLAFYFRWIAARGKVAEIRNGTTVLATLQLASASSVLEVRAEGGTLQTGSATLSAGGSFDFVEFRYTKGTGANAIAEVRVNSIVDATSSDGTSTAQADAFRLFSSASTAIHHFDDLRSNDTAYPGDGVVAGLRPDAAGDETDFTGTFADIDDDPIVDATLREQDGGTPIPFIDNVGALADVGTINQVRVKVRAARTNGAGRSHFIRWLKPGGTAENSADLSLDGTVRFFSFTPSDQPTTQAHIDDMQAGMSQDAAGGRKAQCTELWIMVDRTPAAVGKRRVMTIMVN